MPPRASIRPALLLALLLLAAPAQGQERFRVFHADGTPASLDAIGARLDSADVLFIGETHDDSVAHVLEQHLLEAAHARRGEDVALSLEMFDRDVQPVVNEYLAGLITENHFLQSSRPWANYADYRPLVTFARMHGLPVIASNAPRRYVNRVSRLGSGALGDLPDAARAHLAPLPYPGPSEAYRARWEALFAGGAHGTGSGDASPHDSSATDGRGGEPASPHGAGHDAMPSVEHLLAAQALWDATMAHSLATHLLRRPEALVVHVVGGFHVETRAGLPDVLQRYRPGTESVVVAIRPAASFDPDVHEGLGDFVILTTP